jgi:hypothetical protein
MERRVLQESRGTAATIAALRRHVGKLRKLDQKRATHSGWLWSSPAALITDRGLWWQGSSLPRGIHYSRRRACFYNALMLALDHPDFLYVEGYAYQPGLIPVHHGWCIDPGGAVVDTTWRPRDNADVTKWVYFGVPIHTRFAADVMIEQPSYFGVLHDSLADYPLLRTPAEVWWRPEGDSEGSEIRALDR